MYAMRMARVNITVPDAVLARAREAGLNVSRLATATLEDELLKRDKIVAFDEYMAEIHAAQGPIPQAELIEAQRWVDAILAEAGPQRRSA